MWPDDGYGVVLKIFIVKVKYRKNVLITCARDICSNFVICMYELLVVLQIRYALNALTWMTFLNNTLTAGVFWLNSFFYLKINHSVTSVVEFWGRESTRADCHTHPKIQQTKMFVNCQRFGDLFLFRLVSQYSTNQIQYNKGRFKVMATYFHQ